MALGYFTHLYMPVWRFSFSIKLHLCNYCSSVISVNGIYVLLLLLIIVFLCVDRRAPNFISGSSGFGPKRVFFTLHFL